MQCFSELTNAYPKLFRKDAEKGNQRGEETIKKKVSFTDVWGWYCTLDGLSNNDRTKWDYFLDMKIIEFLNTLSYFRDKQKDQQRQIDEATGKNRIV